MPPHRNYRLCSAVAVGAVTVAGAVAVVVAAAVAVSICFLAYYCWCLWFRLPLSDTRYHCFPRFGFRFR